MFESDVGFEWPEHDQAYYYSGGPLDGEVVELEEGWPYPEVIGAVSWLGEYVQNFIIRRYIWTLLAVPPTTGEEA